MTRNKMSYKVWD